MTCDYPIGCDQVVTTTTTVPSSPALPNTGARVDTPLFAGVGLVLIGALALVAIAKFPLRRRK